MKTAHVYLNDAEQSALDRLGDELGMSSSGVLRLGLRLLAGVPIPERVLELALDKIRRAELAGNR